MKGFARYVGAVVLAGCGVAAVGAVVPNADARAVGLGAGVGCAAQLFAVWLLDVRLVPGRRLLAHGLGTVWRMTVLAVLALSLLGAPLAFMGSALFALVALFFVSTVMEPVFLRTEPIERR